MKTIPLRSKSYGLGTMIHYPLRRFLNIRGVFVFIHRRGWFVLLNPMKDPNAKRIQVVDDINKLMSEVDVASGAGSAGGTGGMVTKLTAKSTALLV